MDGMTEYFLIVILSCSVYIIIECMFKFIVASFYIVWMIIDKCIEFIKGKL